MPLACERLSISNSKYLSHDNLSSILAQMYIHFIIRARSLVVSNLHSQTKAQNLNYILLIYSFDETLHVLISKSSRYFLFENSFLTVSKDIIISLLHQRNTVRKYIFQKKQTMKQK